MKQPQSGQPARMTPYELVFGDAAGLEAATFPAIRDEAGALGIDPNQHERFRFLTRAGDLLRDLVPDEAPPDALEQYHALIYHGFNFWRLGKRLYVLEPAVVRFLVEGAPTLAGWELAVPYPSLYLQLPANLFWASIAQDVPPEPVDGFFVTASEGVDPLGLPFQRLEALLVLGIRRDRAGFSVIPLDTEAGPGIAAQWMAAPGRGGARDFQSVLPGGEMAGLYSITTAAEALKLLARALWYIDQHPESLTLEHAREHRQEERPDAPPASGLAFQRVSLAPDAPGADPEAGA